VPALAARRRRPLIIGAIVLAVLAGGLVGVYAWQRPLLRTGTGYAAHNACAVTSVAGRDNPDADLPPNPLVPYLRTEVTDGSASATLLGALARQQAWYTDGFGCTLAATRPVLPEPAPDPLGANAIVAAGSPTTSTELQEIVGRAFGDGLSDADRDALGTRGVVVLKGGQLIAERYASGFTASTPQLGWSMSKSVASLVTGRLAAQGAVSLDDSHLRPEWTDGRSAITIRQLLQMTSGLSWDETYDLGTPITQMLYAEPDMGAYVASRPLAYEPGTHLQYSSGSSTLLCAILAPDFGGANLSRTQLLAPLGLGSAVMEPDAAGTPVCSSYLWATPREWASIGQFALDDGVWNGQRLLPSGWMTETTTAVRGVTVEDAGYAAGWWANTAADGTLVYPELPADTYSAQGHDGQWVVVVPSEQLVVARLGFTPSLDDDKVPALVAELVAALH